MAAVAAAYGNRKTRLPLARYANRKGYRDALNLTHGATMAGHVIGHAVQSGGIAPDEIDDVVLGCAMPRGATGYNIARFAAHRAGLPVTTNGVTVDRQRVSSLQAIVCGAYRILNEGAKAVVAGGVESVSPVQAPGTGACSQRTIRLDQDEGVRQEVSLDRLRSLLPILESGAAVTPGNACKLPDGASACLMIRESALLS